MGEIGTKMVGPLPGINILEMIHSIIEGFDARGFLIKLISAENPFPGENSFFLQLSDDFFCLTEKSFCSLFHGIRQFEAFQGQGFDVALEANPFDHLLSNLFLLLF
jgi:hypothetical protein